MSTRDRNHGLSDELLTAFIDGELGADEAARVEALIGADPSVAERFDQLSRADLPYIAAFEPLLNAAPGDRLEAMLASIPPVKASHRFSTGLGRRGFLAAAACVIAGIAIDRAVIGVDRRLRQPGEGAEWRAVVADYVALYSPDTLSAPAGDRAEQLAELDRVGSKIGLSLSPEAIALPGADFRRALVLQYDGEPLAQIAYLDPEDGPMALCIVKSAAAAAGPETERRHGMNVVYWSGRGHAFMLIGHAAPDRMKIAAEQVRARLSA
ncbi:anti-sigma factor family protein [Rhizobium tumorigenes]|uniref:anti-sigma factor family protein n=1 Tax=Rhizobium tumorigenes TaxID=2041385 RepID=UPI00241FC3AC|nr:anti-sigma factor [Rhizobium tumorigenes]WFS01340.1 anti-sigma factor [Rhizobium tumorigenes]